jgi:hydrogenase maturation protein HypF
MESRRHRIVLGGAVQGVGLRPFVYRLAHSLDLAGFVQNSCDGVVIEVEGSADRLSVFSARLYRERPAAACVTSQQLSRVPSVGAVDFVIAGSDPGVLHAAGMTNDLATCRECLREMLDPANRRFGYPFANCTQCGPRFTISEALPYDRASTTMRGFEMCEACRAEYDTPSDRRFHAQPTACPACGPQLSMDIADVAEALRAGSIVALKGLGGFQLLCDACNGAVVDRLRARKARDHKPFAVMMASLECVRRFCDVSGDEAAVLASPAAPIVLLKPRLPTDLSPSVSGRSPFTGVMLPYSPLHHLLMRACGIPLVATSGNVAGEPIATDDSDARRRLGSIADLFVVHDRPIARPCDDSVVRAGAHGLSPVRRARGYAPLPIHVGVDLPRALAVGGHLKNTFAIALGRDVVVSQHIGDLDTLEARRGFELAIADFCRMHRFTPELVVADLHPDYASTRWAVSAGYRLVQVQHHEAHVAACAAENGVTGPYLGVAWDGAGLGHDGTVWGGEFFLADGARFTRMAHLRPFPLLGGDAAAKEGWRVALAMDWVARGHAALDGRLDARLLEPVLARGVNAPSSSSVGRLFDAVAAVTGISDRNRFEGESAMALEAAIDPGEQGVYPFGDDLTGDWEPLLDAIRADLHRKEPVAAIATRFHRALVGWIGRVAVAVGVRPVVLSGGAFQNAFLADQSAVALAARGHLAYTHHQVPSNDGGLSLGQVMLSRFAARMG